MNIDQPNSDHSNGIIATVENSQNPSQVVAIKYMPDEQAFVTSGIQSLFGEKEILMPAHLMVVDFQLMGTIVAAILEKLSLAQDMEGTFEYAAAFQVMDKKFTLNEYGDYVKLLADEG